jgi:hypothetical protein
VLQVFRGVAAIVAQSEQANGSPVIWAMLVDQLGRTLRAIGDVHGACGEAEMAKVLVGDLSKEYEKLHDQLEPKMKWDVVLGKLVDEREAVACMTKKPDHEAHHRRHSPNQGRGFGR